MNKSPLCNCEECPLRERQFVATTGDQSPTIAIIGDHPSYDDTLYKMPFSDKMGEFIRTQLWKNGISHNEILYTNVIACKPKEKIDVVVRTVDRQNMSVKKSNRERTNRGLMPFPLKPIPQDACRGRLINELQGIDKFVVFGTIALHSIVGDNVKAKNLRGSPIEVEFGGRVVMVFPMLHPRLLYKFQQWREVFVSDIAKMTRLFHSDQKWEEPSILYRPSISQIGVFLSSPNIPFWSFDIEVDGIDSLVVQIRCISIGHNKNAIVIPFQQKRGKFRYYSQSDEQNIIYLLKEFFENQNIVKVGHNVGYFDNVVLFKQFGIHCVSLVDTMILHKIISPRLPHSLGFCGSLYTDAPNWKENRRVRGQQETDHDLHKYCAYDTIIASELVVKLWRKCVALGLENLIHTEHVIQRICSKLRLTGLYIHPIKITSDLQKHVNEETKRLHNDFNSHSNVHGFITSTNPLQLEKMKHKGYFFPKTDWVFIQITFPYLETLVFACLHNIDIHTDYYKSMVSASQPINFVDVENKLFNTKIDKKLLCCVRESSQFQNSIAETYERVKSRYNDISLKEIRFLVERWRANISLDSIQNKFLEIWREKGSISEPIMQRRFVIVGDETESELHKFQTYGAIASILREIVMLIDSNMLENAQLVYIDRTEILLECHGNSAKDTKNYITDLITQHQFDLIGSPLVPNVEIILEW